MNVWKYTLNITDYQEIELGGKLKQVLSVLNQYECLVLYCLVEPDNNTHPLNIRVHGTGHPIVDPSMDTVAWTFLDSVLMANGNLIWHVWYQYLEGIE